jgi:ribonuclease D
MYSSCLEHAFMIWFRSANSIRARSSIAASEAGQMAASDYVLMLFKNRLHLGGRPQMSTRPSRPPQYGSLAKNVREILQNVSADLGMPTLFLVSIKCRHSSLDNFLNPLL